MSTTEDLELLRRFEPIVRYTRGEFFFPMAIEPYVSECDLWGESAAGERTLLAQRGDLTVESLPAWQTKVPDLSLFLRYVQEPLSGLELTKSGRPKRAPFRAPSRLARVGVVARLIDAGFDLSLIVRGTVPGGTVAASEIKYARTLKADPNAYYHGRVVRQSGWIICHYLFFYAMNDWRSSFAGANDHEADWEQCLVFVQERQDRSLEPIWFARAAHDEVGADLRRRWDDPVLLREGNHPIVFAGAGSHAAYVEPGEYLLAVPLRLPRLARSVARNLRNFWVDFLRQGPRRPVSDGENVAAVPFIDYARGDGVAVGPGQAATWTPILIDDATPWVSGFDGLFGLDTKDRFAGERAPAGPKFNRDGRPRQSWIDPVGFAGLHGVPTPDRLADVLDAQRRESQADFARTQAQIEGIQIRAQRLASRLDASRRAGRSPAVLDALDAERREAIHELTALNRHAEDLRVAISDTGAELERVRAGDRGDARMHLRFVAHPQAPGRILEGRLLDIWSAIGTAAAIFLLGALLILDVGYWWVGLVVIGSTYALIEALVRRRVLVLLLNISVLLAVVASGLMVWLYLPQAVASLITVVGLLILRDNFRELRASYR